jgi:hypothetical protein
MKKIYRLLVTIVILWCCFAFLASPMEIRLDGKADEAEWKDAQKYELKNGGSLLVRKGENEIWVSLESSKKGWVQIYISAGDTIRVLHASAALGERDILSKNSYGMLYRILNTSCVIVDIMSRWQQNNRTISRNLDGRPITITQVTEKLLNSKSIFYVLAAHL